MADTLPLSLNSTFVGLVVHSLPLLSMQTFSPSILPHLTSSFAAVILTTATRGRCLILNVIICCHKCFAFLSSEEMCDMFDTYLMIKCWVYEGLTSIKHGVNVIHLINFDVDCCNRGRMMIGGTDASFTRVSFWLNWSLIRRGGYFDEFSGLPWWLAAVLD